LQTLFPSTTLFRSNTNPHPNPNPGGETETDAEATTTAVVEHPRPPRDECIGADEEVAITSDAQWRRLIGSHPWSVEATRAHTLLYIQVRCESAVHDGRDGV
jgi:hypothetical protein